MLKVWLKNGEIIDTIKVIPNPVNATLKIFPPRDNFREVPLNEVLQILD